MISGAIQLDLGRQSLGLPALEGAQNGLPSVPNRSSAKPRPNAYFVAGQENALLAGLYETLFDTSGALPVCNPLTLVGPAGIGKSHLVQGILRRWQAEQTGTVPTGQVRAAYYSAVDFGREFQAVQNESGVIPWRRELREVGLLVIEDLDGLRDRTTIRQELCSTMDAIIQRGGQVLLTASREPVGLSNLQRDGRGTGVIDRLAGGLVLRLQPPGTEARAKFLELAAKERGLDFTPERIAKLTQQTAGFTPARLLGLLTEEDYSDAAGIEERSDAAGTSASGPTMKEILAVVCRYLGIRQRELASSSRRKSLVQARGMVVYLARRLSSLSYAEIGRSLGGRDHSTVINAMKRVEIDLPTVPALQQALEELERILQAT
ncbi:Chromosomal replication initiator protein DnaA [Adhaeretor mobilis]|uniref:Chromosomal replication initiator protein DnaA n=1 Tax=Adhaeretor mobilis TaxID=1930276 RepID=A0A517MPD0_9BACT|nr:Chromosomal replication initiator protein DnaA [Adhaeretor mobilis]